MYQIILHWIGADMSKEDEQFEFVASGNRFNIFEWRKVMNEVGWVLDDKRGR